MSGGAKIELTSTSLVRVNKLLNNVANNFPDHVVKLIHAEALIIESQAKKNLVSELQKRQPKKNDKSTYHGLLSASIHSKNNSSGADVSASKNYAAYIEFGTGNMVSIPAGWEAFAAKFKGSGIRPHNMKARPYLVKAFIEEQKNFIDRLKKLASNIK